MIKQFIIIVQSKKKKKETEGYFDLTENILE